MEFFKILSTFVLSVGAFYLFAIAGLIGKIVQYPWMNGLYTQNNSLIPIIFLIVAIYESIIIIESIKESLKDKKSGLHIIPYRRIWAPIVIVVSLSTSVIFFMIGLQEVCLEVCENKASWYPGGWIALYYLLGLFGPIPKMLIFNPSVLWRFLSSKYDQNLEN